MCGSVARQAQPAPVAHELSSSGDGSSGKLQGQHDILKRSKRRQQLERLEHKPDLMCPKLCLLVFTELVDHRPVQLNCALSGRIEAREQTQERGFAGAGTPDNSYGLSPIDFESDPLARS